MKARAIWKFTIAITDEQVVMMPAGSKPISAAIQFRSLCLWAIVDTDALPVQRIVRVAGTGHALPDVATAENFVDTFMVDNGALVFHVFVLPEQVKSS